LSDILQKFLVSSYKFENKSRNSILAKHIAWLTWLFAKSREHVDFNENMAASRSTSVYSDWLWLCLSQLSDKLTWLSLYTTCGVSIKLQMSITINSEHLLNHFKKYLHYVIYTVFALQTLQLTINFRNIMFIYFFIDCSLILKSNLSKGFYWL